MSVLDELIARYRSGELSFKEFVETAASLFVHSKPLDYPETDGNEAVLFGVSNVTIQTAVWAGELTQEEAEAIYSAIPATV